PRGEVLGPHLDDRPRVVRHRGVGCRVAGRGEDVAGARRHARPDRAADHAPGHVEVPGEDLARRLVITDHAAAYQRVVAVRRDTDVDSAVGDGRRGPLEVVA